MTQLLFSQTSIERWSDCLLRDESVLTQLLESQVLVAMVQYDMSDDCDGEVTRGSLTCLVPELPRVVKSVVPRPSMIRQRIVKTHDLVETRSTPEDHLVVVCQHGQIASSVRMSDQHVRTMRGDLEVRHRRRFMFSFMRLIGNSSSLDLYHIF